MKIGNYAVNTNLHGVLFVVNIILDIKEICVNNVSVKKTHKRKHPKSIVYSDFKYPKRIGIFNKNLRYARL